MTTKKTTLSTHRPPECKHPECSKSLDGLRDSGELRPRVYCSVERSQSHARGRRRRMKTAGDLPPGEFAVLAHGTPVYLEGLREACDAQVVRYTADTVDQAWRAEVEDRERGRLRNAPRRRIVVR